MLDISNVAGTPQWPNVRYIEHSAWVTFSALTMFVLAGNPSKPIGGPAGRPGILQEQLCHLWRSCFQDYL